MVGESLIIREHIDMQGIALGKAVLATPLYISIAWALMISYQLFTQIAVTTVVTYMDLLWPSVGSWLISRVDMLIFIYAFSWAFVLSSVIPSVILGKERSILIQYFVILTLTFIAFVIRDALTIVCECDTIDQIFSVAAIFRDPLLAAGYLSIPYILMFTIDMRSRKRRKVNSSVMTGATTASIGMAMLDGSRESLNGNLYSF